MVASKIILVRFPRRFKKVKFHDFLVKWRVHYVIMVKSPSESPIARIQIWCQGVGRVGVKHLSQTELVITQNWILGEMKVTYCTQNSAIIKYCLQ